MCKSVIQHNLSSYIRQSSCYLYELTPSSSSVFLFLPRMWLRRISEHWTERCPDLPLPKLPHGPQLPQGHRVHTTFIHWGQKWNGGDYFYWLQSSAKGKQHVRQFSFNVLYYLREKLQFNVIKKLLIWCDFFMVLFVSPDRKKQFMKG